jgi:hypothetical protein
MTVTPHFAPPLDAVLCNHPRATTFNLPCFALSAFAFIRTSNRAIDEAQQQASRRAKALYQQD